MDLNLYNTTVESAASEEKNELLWNDGRTHNVIIMKEMFKNSHEIMMFCGKGSIFRNSFSKTVCDEVEKGCDFIDDLYEQINSFLRREGKLTIILEKTSELNDVADKILDNLKQKQDDGMVTIYKLDDDLKPEYHFSVGDNNKYRREIGAEEHNAFANFNDRDKVDMLKKQFYILLQSSHRTKIANN